MGEENAYHFIWRAVRQKAWRVIIAGFLSHFHTLNSPRKREASLSQKKKKNRKRLMSGPLWEKISKCLSQARREYV